VAKRAACSRENQGREKKTRGQRTLSRRKPESGERWGRLFRLQMKKEKDYSRSSCMGANGSRHGRESNSGNK